MRTAKKQRKFTVSAREGIVSAKRRLLVGCLAAMTFLNLPRTVVGQNDPRQILRGVIQQVQTGRPNPTWYGAQLWQLIAYQTAGSGIYPQLVQLGAVRDVTITAQVPLPTGVVYGMSVQHAGGRSYWEFGISTMTNRIEYASFVAQPGAEMDREPLPEPRPQPTPPPTPGKGGSEACKKFPNLC
jgi:hypothetical protein